MPENYATLQDIRDDADDPEFGPVSRTERTTRLASRIVTTMSRPPEAGSEEEPAFLSAARDATVAVFWYLWETKGFLSSRRSVTDAATSYAANPEILNLVAMNLGGHFADPNSDSGRAVLGGVPRKDARFRRRSSSYAPPDLR